MSANDDQISEMSDEDRDRISRVLSQTVGPHTVHFGPDSYLDVWITEHRMQAERRIMARLSLATRVLVGATAVLAFATIPLVIANAANG
jgi:hypothetical protein